MAQPTLIADYSWVSDASGLQVPEENWSPAELAYGDMDSARKFWTLVLLLAGRDHVASVQFFPHLGDDCLSCTVADVNYPMVPPPVELREWLLYVGRNFCAGGNWRGLLWRWKALTLRRQSSNLVALEFWGNRIQWTATYGPLGLLFRRESEADPCVTAA